MTNNQINETLRLRIELAKSKAYLDIYDVSILSGFSISTLRKRVNEKKLKALQNVPNGKLLFKKEDVDSWLQGGAR